MSQQICDVSVVIPAYNCSGYIKKAVSSVMTQTVLPKEIIIVEDGSSDDTMDILEKIAEGNDLVKLYSHGINLGTSFSRNFGVRQATGKWIAFMDADDIWDPVKLQKQCSLMEGNGYQFTFTGVRYIDEHNKPYPGQFEVPASVTGDELLKQNVISCSSVMIQRNLMERYPMKHGDFHEDFEVWIRILKEVPRAYGINEPLLIYRISSASKSGNKLKSFWMNYKTYLKADFGPVESARYMCHYTINGIRKYRNIRS